MRGDTIESQHIIYVVVIDQDGKIIFSTGNEDYITCIRSSLKPFQASTLIKYDGHNKFGFTNKELSLLCASHSAENQHTNLIDTMLKKINCTKNDLECGAHPAYDRDTRHHMLKNDIPFTNVHNNCSGKHVGMLALAKTLDINHTGYIKNNHEVQKKISQNILKYSKTQPHSFATDGCSVPVPFYSLYTIAQMYLQLINGSSKQLDILYNAMTQYPYMVAGKNRFDSDFMLAIKGRGISKGGGEAIQGLAMKTTKHGLISMALKVVSGSHLVRDVAIMEVLKYLGYLSTEENDLLKNYIKKSIYNHNQIHTGYVTAEISV